MRVDGQPRATRVAERPRSVLLSLLVALTCMTFGGSCAVPTRGARPNSTDRTRFEQWQRRGLTAAVTSSGDAEADERLRALLEATGLFADVATDAYGEETANITATVLGAMHPGGEARRKNGSARRAPTSRFILRAPDAALVIADGGTPPRGNPSEAEEFAELAAWLSIEIVKSDLHRRIFYGQ